MKGKPHRNAMTSALVASRGRLTTIFWNVWIIGCLLTVFAGSLGAEQPISIAIVGPMVGTSNAVGIQYKVGVTAALKTLTDDRLLGRKVVLQLHDDSCEAAIAENVAKKIAENPPAVVIGHSCSGATIAGAPIYAAHHIIQITPASTNPGVTEMGISTLFRMIGRDDVQGKMAAERIADLYSQNRIGVFYFPSSYSKGLMETAVTAMTRFGISPALQIQSPPSSPSYAEAVAAFMAQKIEVLYIAGGGGLDIGIFLRQARQMGATFLCLGADTLVSDVFPKTAGSAAEGVPFTFPPEAASLSTAGPAVQTIQAMGREPAGYTLLAYAATQVWIEAVKRADSFDAVAVSRAIRQQPIPTILGEVAFDEKGDIITPYQPFSWFVWKDENLVPLE